MTDIIFAGGGVMACATAYHLLKRDPNLKITIVERDSTYRRASTTLSDGNIRQQFNLKENILISNYGLEVLATFADDMAIDGEKPETGFKQQGNLFLVSAENETPAREGLRQQQSLGCEVRWLEPAQVQELYPLYNLQDCVGATFGAKNGTMSPLDVLLAYRRKAVSMGATILEAEVSALCKDGTRMTGVQLTSGKILQAGIVLNTAGAWGVELARTVGVELPIESVKREVYAIDTDARPERLLPGILFPNGQYCFHEGDGMFTTGGKQPDDKVTKTDFGWNRERFESNLWEGLVNYLPSFDRLKVTNGWAGLYAMNTFDGNGIIGAWPDLTGLYMALGFSGHGFQQSHAVGRYLAELILGQTPTLDLSILSPQRILDQTPVYENPYKLI